MVTGEEKDGRQLHGSTEPQEVAALKKTEIADVSNLILAVSVVTTGSIDSSKLQDSSKVECSPGR